MDKKDLPCQAGRDQGVKYELVEKSDDIVFCHRLFQEVFAYQHVLTKTQTMDSNCKGRKIALTTLGFHY